MWRRVAWMWLLVAHDSSDGLVAPSVVQRRCGLCEGGVRSSCSQRRSTVVAARRGWRRGPKKSEAVTTSDWGYFSKRPVRRGLALTRAAIGVAVARRKARRLEKKERGEEADAVRRTAAELLTERLIRLGPTYVKLGQIASNREELEGSEWAKALSRLQDDVPPFDTAPAAIERELGGRASFSSVDETPLAAASLGQVHRAVLRATGEEVAVKIQRPDLLSIYETDARLLRRLARLGDLVSRGRRRGGELSWADLCNDSIAVLYRELDYTREAANGERFFAALADYSDWVRCPRVHTDLSTEKMLVMEYVPGISLKKLADLDARGFDRKLLAERLARAYLLQFCKFGVFNADPHAGNLAADDDGRLVLYDFGQVSELTPDQSNGIYDVIQSIIDMDAVASVRAFEKMGVLKPGADFDKIVAVVQSNFDTGRVKSRACLATKTMQRAKPAGPAPDQASVMQYFQLPATYAFVARALSQLTGVGQALDPEFEFIAAAAPSMPEVQGTQSYLKDIVARRWRAFTELFVGRDSPNFDNLVANVPPPVNGRHEPTADVLAAPQVNGQSQPRNGHAVPSLSSSQQQQQQQRSVPAAR